VLILLAVGFALYQKNKKITIQKLQLEIQNSRNISEINLNKKQFAERLISANQAVNKRLEKISSKLKNSQFGKNPEIVQARKELDAITELKGEWSLEMQQIQTIDDISFLLDHFKCIQNFNQTEQSLLAYLLNGHKIKEIAALMSLSEQHVRNTKTKVLKALSSEKKIDVTLEFLAGLKADGNNIL
jgi:tRNA(Met) C34 N-acetyltransferase TmcA